MAFTGGRVMGAATKVTVCNANVRELVTVRIIVECPVHTSPTEHVPSALALHPPPPGHCWLPHQISLPTPIQFH